MRARAPRTLTNVLHPPRTLCTSQDMGIPTVCTLVVESVSGTMYTQVSKVKLMMPVMWEKGGQQLDVHEEEEEEEED